MAITSKPVKEDDGPADPVDWLLWKFGQAQERARMFGYEVPRCVGDILVLLCHRDDETRREAEENFTNTLKTVERLNASDVAHLNNTSKLRARTMIFNDAIDYPENLVKKVSGGKGVILRLSPHGKYKLVQDAEAVRTNSVVHITPQQVKDLYLAIRAAGFKEFVHPNNSATTCIGKLNQSYDNLPFWKMFPTSYQHQMIRDSSGNTFPICHNKGDCDVRSLVIGYIALAAQGDQYVYAKPRKPAEKIRIAEDFTAQKMSVANMWYNLSSIESLEFHRRHDEVWRKAMEKVDKSGGYTEMLDISKFKALPITVPAETPVYQAKVKEEK